MVIPAIAPLDVIKRMLAASHKIIIIVLPMFDSFLKLRN
mgnify:CR=1 FL=1